MTVLHNVQGLFSAHTFRCGVRADSVNAWTACWWRWSSSGSTAHTWRTSTLCGVCDIYTGQFLDVEALVTTLRKCEAPLPACIFLCVVPAGRFLEFEAQYCACVKTLSLLVPSYVESALASFLTSRLWWQYCTCVKNLSSHVPPYVESVTSVLASILSCRVRRCLSRLLLTLKPFWQYSQTKGFSPVCVRLCISIDACDGNFLLHTVHVLWANPTGRVTRALLMGLLLLWASSLSVCVFWMCLTQSPGVGNCFWQRSHCRGGNDSSSSWVYR